MKQISRFLAVLAAAVSTPLFAQQGANTVITGVEGLPWGSTREQVEAKLGAPTPRTPGATRSTSSTGAGRRSG